MKRITSPNPGRYNGKTSTVYKRLQQIENIIIDKYNIDTYEDLDKILEKQQPLDASKHIHSINELNVAVKCECGHFVFDNEYYTDYYCPSCGQKIDWGNLRDNRKKILEDNIKIKKQVGKLVEKLRESYQNNDNK